MNRFSKILIFFMKNSEFRQKMCDFRAPGDNNRLIFGVFGEISPNSPTGRVFFSTSFWSKIISRYTRTIYASRALQIRGDIRPSMCTNHSQVLLKTEAFEKFQLWPREPPSIGGGLLLSQKIQIRTFNNSVSSVV